MLTGTQSTFSPNTYTGNQRTTHIESVTSNVFEVVLPRGQEILLYAKLSVTSVKAGERDNTHICC